MKPVLRLSLMLSLLFLVFLVPGCNRHASEFRKADEAISQARSWRVTVSTPNVAKLRMEAIPPDRSYVWQERMLRGSLVHFEYIRIGQNNYIRGDDVTPKPAPDWVPVAPNQIFFEVGAGLQFRMNDAFQRRISTNIADLLDLSDLVDLGLKTYAGHSCREWAGTRVGSDNLSRHQDTVCLGIVDHLPYHVYLDDTKFDAQYEWNPELSIDAPAVNTPR